MPTAAEYQAEVDLVRSVINHPAGFDLDLFGGMLVIRSTGGPMSNEETFEVEWNMMIGSKAEVGTKSFPKEQPGEAANFFVKKRHELRCGIDFEQIDMAAHTKRESPR